MSRRDSLKEPLILKNDMQQVSDSSDVFPKHECAENRQVTNHQTKDLQDKYYLAYIIMLIQGMGNLLPWNCLINAAPYYSQRLCGSQYAASFESVISLAFNGTQLVFLVLMLYKGDRYSQHKLIVGALSINVLVFAGMAGMVLSSSMDPETFYGLTVAGTLLSAAMCSIHQGAIFAAAAPFPAIYTQALMTGQAVVGLANAMVGLLTALPSAGSSSSDDVEEEEVSGDGLCPDSHLNIGALLYFVFACVMLLVSLISYLALVRLTFYKVYSRKASNFDLANLVEFDYNAENGMDTPLEISRHDSLVQQTASHDSWLYSMTKIIQQLWPSALSVCLTFCITLMLFPSATSKIVSSKSPNTSRLGVFFKDNIFILFSFLNFNFGDFAGRALSGRFQIVGPNWLCVFSVARIVFFPLFLMCNIENSRLPVVFRSDFWPIFFMVLFSVSNGYIASLGMMYGPRNVSSAFKSSAATFMVLSLILGLTLGSSISFLTLVISIGSI